MTRRKRTGFYVRRVPSRDDVASAVRVRADRFDHVRDLVDCRIGLISVVWMPRFDPTIPASPLCAVNQAQVAMFVGPFVPDVNPLGLKRPDVRVAGQHPQKFGDYALREQTLRRQKREAVAKIEAHLFAEQRTRADAGAVVMAFAVQEHPHRKIAIRLVVRIVFHHGVFLSGIVRSQSRRR